ncbi:MULTISPECIES: DUF2798 domain-containing protein [Achromobacter]|jgi:hypothetical protein|uniref:DUF2798 domain-containing protein n=1 Tax=Achromobacter aegrifaciens TaxID=1287736 RepID=A0AAD2KKD6_ACHAE|nr:MULTISPECIES: DUF2798 domain-containing protein [Achromobacter]PTN51839.1 DUF2798 domain-containing protein [Achromobacter xylosoxidans]MBD9473491.1 DUF2798 domain-containing protein [Achromobacter sp. ACM01]MDQ1760155.1 DUF2798 domain-containing protein [Achromobacter aegrifaciens]MDR7948459.1 DUF2798 domain-containing protein [Achromobacter aegrifaciens]RIJ01435.1 DUF2798 domain-containing protein [Achromobacter sp. K91]
MADHSSSPTLKKLPRHYAPVLMPLVLSVFMSAIVSAVATAASVGVGPDFVLNWPSAWGASWIVAFPSLLLLLPVVRRIVAWMVVPP